MNESKSKRKFVMPHIYVILFALITLSVIATYIVPAGSYDREEVDGRSIIIPDTFSYAEQTPVGILDFMTAIPRGVEQTVAIIFGIMAIGALFRVIEKAGIIDVILNFLIRSFGNKGMLIIPTIVIPLALFVALTGNIESSLIFLPALLPLFLRLGYDRMAATGTVLMATVVGFAVAITAPANLGTAQTIAELPLYSGIGFRLIILAVMLAVGILFIIFYIKKVQKDPSKTLITDNVDNSQFIKDETDAPELSTRTYVGTGIFILALGFMLFGIFQYQWYFTELAGFYLFAGIVSGLVAGLKPSGIAEAMNEGIQNIVLGALIVGVARAISVVLEDGAILDTVVYGLSIIVTMIPETFVPVAMMVTQGLLNFLIPSGSGQAAATMPIMVGLVDLTDMTRQTAVLAFQFGDGFSNIFYPTSGYFMAALAIAKIKYTDWIKFIWPLLLIWYGLGAVFLIIAYFINWGPF